MIEGGVGCTVNGVLPETPPEMAEMVLVPAETVVAKPEELIVARAVAEETQVTRLVRFWVELSE